MIVCIMMMQRPRVKLLFGRKKKQPRRTSKLNTCTETSEARELEFKPTDPGSSIKLLRFGNILLARAKRLTVNNMCVA